MLQNHTFSELNQWHKSMSLELRENKDSFQRWSRISCWRHHQ